MFGFEKLFGKKKYNNLLNEKDSMEKRLEEAENDKKILNEEITKLKENEKSTKTVDTNIIKEPLKKIIADLNSNILKNNPLIDINDLPVDNNAIKTFF